MGEAGLPNVELPEQRAAAAAREVDATRTTRLAPADAHVHLAFAHEVEEALLLATYLLATYYLPLRYDSLLTLLAFAHEVEEARRLALLLQPLAAQGAALLEGVAELLHLVRVGVGGRVGVRVGVGVRVRVRVSSGKRSCA